MAEDLNGYLSSVFTREDISSLPVPYAKFQEATSDYLEQLIVTPKLQMETVEQISIPFGRVFKLSLKEGAVPFEWK